MLTTAATAFGVIGVFVAEQDEPAKIWNLASVLIAGAVMVGFLVIEPRLRVLQRPLDHRATGALTAALTVIIGVVINPFYSASAPGPTPTPTPGPTASATAGPTEFLMHGIWPSSAENVAHALPQGTWVATEFLVEAPLLRSIEVAAGANGPGRLLLSVYDEHQQEIASGEAPVSDWRAKYTFEKLVDISAYQGKRLFLVARNLWPEEVRVYFTKQDRDTRVSTYLSCPDRKITRCANPAARDLSAAVVARR